VAVQRCHRRERHRESRATARRATGCRAAFVISNVEDGSAVAVFMKPDPDAFRSVAARPIEADRAPI
jgi:hypothetical protein